MTDILVVFIAISFVSRAGLNDLYAASQKNLDVEQNLRQQLEQELDTMKRLKEEKEVSLTSHTLSSHHVIL